MAFSKNDREILDRFFFLKEAGRFDECILLLAGLNKKHPNNRVINGLFGTVYYMIGEYRKSCIYFRKTTHLRPSSEMASLGLFHSLMHLEKSMPAFREMKRFLSVGQPKAYLVTIRELYESIELFDTDERKMITDAYSAWVRPVKGARSLGTIVRHLKIKNRGKDFSG